MTISRSELKQRADEQGFVIEDGVLLAYVGEGYNLNVPAGVRVIGEGAFRSCDSVSSVRLPQGVERIGDWAFCDCRDLGSLIVPDSVQSIGEGAFQGCVTLARLELPEQVAIGSCAFRGCRDLADNTGLILVNGVVYEYLCQYDDVALPEQVRRLEHYSFTGTTVNDVQLNDGLEEIGDSVFANCRCLRQLDLPDSLRSLGDGVFAGCVWLQELTIPDAVERLDERLVNGCARLKRISVPRPLQTQAQALQGHNAELVVRD